MTMQVSGTALMIAISFGVAVHVQTASAQEEQRRDYGKEAIELIRSFQSGAATEPNQWALYGWVCSEGANLAEMFEEHNDVALAFAEEHPDLYVWNEIAAGGSEPTYPELRAAWERFESGIEDNSRFFDRLYSLAQSNHLVPPKPRKSLLEEFSPTLSQSRLIGSMLQIRMQTQLQHEDLDGLVQTYESSLGLGYANAATGASVNYIVGVSHYFNGNKAAMRSCYSGALDEAHCQQLIDITSRFPIPSADLAVEYDRLILLEAIDEFYWTFSNDGPNGAPGGEQFVRLVSGLASHGEAIAEGNRLYDAIRDSLCSTGEAKEQADAVLDHFRTLESSEDWQKRFKVIFLGSPSVGEFRRSGIVANTMHNGTIVMLGLELHRLRTGAYPATLMELVPDFLHELPLDPLTNTPLLYQLADDDADYVLYSIGHDETDDSGKPHPNGVFRALEMNSDGFDFVFNDPRFR